MIAPYRATKVRTIPNMRPRMSSELLYCQTTGSLGPNRHQLDTASAATFRKMNTYLIAINTSRWIGPSITGDSSGVSLKDLDSVVLGVPCSMFLRNVQLLRMKLSTKKLVDLKSQIEKAEEEQLDNDKWRLDAMFKDASSVGRCNFCKSLWRAAVRFWINIVNSHFRRDKMWSEKNAMNGRIAMTLFQANPVELNVYMGKVNLNRN